MVSLSLRVIQNSQDIAAKKSNVTIEAVINWTYGTYNSYYQCYGGITAEGKEYLSAVTNFNERRTDSGSQVVMSQTLDIDHNADGTKEISISAWFYTGVTPSTITAKATKQLSTIYQISQPTASVGSVDMGGKVTINTNRASGSFTHDLEYSFAGGGWVSIASDVAGSYVWTTPDLATKIPSAASGTATIRCTTKSGGKTLGSATTTVTLKVPTTVVPQITAISVVEATAGLAAQFGNFVAGKSTVSVKITAAGANGSTIKSYTASLDGTTYTGAEWVSKALSQSGTLKLVAAVTDTRGRTATKTISLSVLDYAPPTLTAFSAYRVTAAGAVDTEGDHIAVTYAYAVAQVGGKNTASMAIQYKKTTETNWVGLLTGSALSANATAKPASPTFSADYAYDLRITVMDWFGATATWEIIVPSGAVILDIAASGNGLGIGKTSERDGVEIAWPLFLGKESRKVGICCKAKGSSTSLTISAGTITPITLDTLAAGPDDGGFSFSGGGVKVPMDGIVLVSGAVYHRSNASGTYVGSYVYKGTAEVTACYNAETAATAVGTPVALVEVSAGDVLYLKARNSAGGTCNPSNVGSHLDIVYV